MAEKIIADTVRKAEEGFEAVLNEVQNSRVSVRGCLKNALECVGKYKKWKAGNKM